MKEDELKNKMVIDATGKIIGKCMKVIETDNETQLHVQIQTQEEGMITVDIPVSTIQGVDETIVLSVEIEGLVEDKEILPYEEPEKLEEEKEKSTKDKEITEEKDNIDDTHWTIYKSIHSNKS